MKIEIEKSLLKARPVPVVEEWNPDRFMGYYFRDHGVAKWMGNYMTGSASSLQAGAGVSVKALASSWNTIPILIGVLYRAQTDGNRVFQMLGMTDDQAIQLMEQLNSLRFLCSEYTAQPQKTLTGMLYDQIQQQGF